MSQMKEQNNTQEKRTKEMEVSKIPKEDSTVINLKILTNPRRMDELEILRNLQTDVKEALSTKITIFP